MRPDESGATDTGEPSHGKRRYGRTGIDERFDTGTLDEDVWTAAYLPAWSSAREAAATYQVDGGGLHLTIPPASSCGALTCTTAR